MKKYCEIKCGYKKGYKLICFIIEKGFINTNLQ